MKAEKHIQFMQRALEIARLAIPNCYPNPAVGAVLVHEGIIIGEGFTQEYGKAHAEVMAIESVEDKELLSESTLYVTLEPCNHQGKTPPCASLILKHNIPRVYVACRDSFKKEKQNGIEHLKSNDVEVIEGICEREALDLNKHFFHFQEMNIPYVILKWAESSDGFISLIRKENEKGIFWITNKKSQQLNHKWRSEEMAILVGKNTVLMDNPKLTARSYSGKNPIRIVIDKDLEISKEALIFNQDAITYIFNSRYNSSVGKHHWIRIDFSKNVALQILEFLAEMNIQSLIVEGGAYTINKFLESNLWNEARIFRGQKAFGDGIKAPVVKGNVMHSSALSGDQLTIMTNGKTKGNEIH